MRLSIIVPTYNHLEDALKPCLESIIQHTDLSDTEIIVVANGCEDGTADYVRSLGKPFRLIEDSKPLGYTRATNLGLGAARGEFLVLLNNDCILLPQPKNLWIDMLLAPMSKGSWITGPVMMWDEDLERHYINFFCVAFSRNVMNQIGPLDTENEFGDGYCEDIDWCIKAVNAGFRLEQVPDAVTPEQAKQSKTEFLFPIYHKAHTTYQDSRSAHIEKNKEILRKKYLTIDGNYHQRCIVASDIHMHLPILSEYANKVFHITEMGVRHVTSTYAWLASNPERLISYDIEPCPLISTVERLAKEHDIDFTFHQQDVLKIDIEPTELLFIDTWHCYDQLKAELHRHAARVSDYIILHDTTSFATSDEGNPNGGIGLQRAVDEFLASNPEWILKEKWVRNSGITILKRKKGKKKFSVVIPTYNHLDDCLKPCIESLIQYTDLSDMEVIIVANGCTDDTREYVHSLGEPFRLIWLEEASGYTVPTNLGIKASTGEYIILLNNDTIFLEQPKNEWVEKMLAPFHTDPNIGATGPLALYDPYAQSRILIFFCTMIKREVFDKIGYLDEIFSPGGGEDIDFTVRLEKAGYTWRQVPDHSPLPQTFTNTGNFGIYHQNNKTFGEMSEYTLTIIKRNGLVNLKRYVKDIRLKFGNLDAEHNVLTVHPDEHSALLKMPYDKLDFDDGSVAEIIICEGTPSNFNTIAEWQRVLREDGKFTIERFGKRISLGKHENFDEYQTPKVYDCFPFFNELDLLEIRLNELDGVVDYFVLSELPVTHKGEPKPLYYEQNKERFKKWKDKIIHIVPDSWPTEEDPWSRERYQRELGMSALKDIRDQDIVIGSDVDEIPRAESIKDFDPIKGVMAFQQRRHNYFLNLDCGVDTYDQGVFSKITTGVFFKKLSGLCELRYFDCTDKIISNGGWHFSYLGGAKKIIHKLESWAHQEWNQPQFKNEKDLQQAIESGKDPLHPERECRFVPVQIPALPRHVFRNQRQYEAAGLIYNTNPTKVDVTAYISTKDRYFTTLPMAIMSVINQTYPIKKLVIFDDGEHRDLRNEAPYREILALLQRKGIEWYFLFAERKGQVANHNKAIEMSETTEWLWRVDDDDAPEPDCLEKLVRNITPEVGAVGGLVHMPSSPPVSYALCSGDIRDIYGKLNLQWSQFKGVKEVDHLHNTFIYRKSASQHGYNRELSPVGHREETLFTYEMKRAGWKVLIDPDAMTWHMRDPNGGIRSHTAEENYHKDEQVFARKLEQYGIQPRNHKLIMLNSGLGDHICFKMVLPEIQKKYPNERIILSVCYPDLFESDDVDLISIEEGKSLEPNEDKHSIYKWCWDHNWTGSIVDAYRRMYL